MHLSVCVCLSVFLCVCVRVHVCVCVCVYAHEFWCPQSPQTSESPEAGVIGGYELPNVGARNLTLVLALGVLNY